MVAPLKIARGTQNKILEAMAMGIPVVTSRIAAGGVDASAPGHFLLASPPDENTLATLRGVEDGAESKRLAVSGPAPMLVPHGGGRRTTPPSRGHDPSLL